MRARGVEARARTVQSQAGLLPGVTADSASHRRNARSVRSTVAGGDRSGRRGGGAIRRRPPSAPDRAAETVPGAAARHARASPPSPRESRAELPTPSRPGPPACFCPQRPPSVQTPPKYRPRRGQEACDVGWVGAVALGSLCAPCGAPEDRWDARPASRDGVAVGPPPMHAAAPRPLPWGLRAHRDHGCRPLRRWHR